MKQSTSVSLLFLKMWPKKARCYISCSVSCAFLHMWDATLPVEACLEGPDVKMCSVAGSKLALSWVPTAWLVKCYWQTTFWLDLIGKSMWSVGKWALSIPNMSTHTNSFLKAAIGTPRVPNTCNSYQQQKTFIQLAEQHPGERPSTSWNSKTRGKEPRASWWRLSSTAARLSCESLQRCWVNGCPQNCELLIYTQENLAWMVCSLRGADSCHSSSSNQSCLEYHLPPMLRFKTPPLAQLVRTTIGKGHNSFLTANEGSSHSSTSKTTCNTVQGCVFAEMSVKTFFQFISTKDRQDWTTDRQG